MDKFTKSDFRELFSEQSQPDFCVMIVEHKTKSGKTSDPEIMSSIYKGCKNFLAASYVSHYTEMTGGLIYCYLNYDSRSFSTRAFVGSLRQIIYNITPGSNSTVYYSDPVKTEKELSDEKDFLFSAIKYAMLLGFSFPFRGVHIHACEASESSLDYSALRSVLESLQHRDFESVCLFLAEKSDFYRGVAREEHLYRFSELMRYVTDIWYALRLYFVSQKYRVDFFEQDLSLLLYETNGVSNLLSRLSKLVEEYMDTFTEQAKSVHDKQHIEDILAYVNNNLSSTNLNDTASHFCLTPEYLCRLFKKNTGENYSEYIKKKRFDKALDLLRNGEKISIAEISTMLGYKSQSHFQNIFKREFGITPDAYRKAFRSHN